MVNKLMVLVISIIVIVLGFTFIIWNFDIGVSITAIVLVMLSIIVLIIIGVVYYLATRESEKDPVKKTKFYQSEQLAKKIAEYVLKAPITYLEGQIKRWEDRDGVIYYAFVFRRDPLATIEKAGLRCVVIINTSSMDLAHLIDHPTSDQCNNPFEDFEPKEREKFMPYDNFGQESAPQRSNKEYTSFKDFVNQEGN